MTLPPSPFDHFQTLYLINLPSRPDRRQEMALQLPKVGLALDHPRVRLFPAIRPAERGGFRTIGAHGCFLSHLGVLREARRRGQERIVICEDDLDFADDALYRLGSIVRELNERAWGFFYGGHRLSGQAHGLVPIPAETPIDTAHFVAFDGAAIAGLVDFLEAILARPPGHPEGGPMDVDGAYTWYRRLHPETVTLAAFPVLGHQRRSRTDIHDLRWFDRAPLVRDGVAGLRRLCNRWRL